MTLAKVLVKTQTAPHPRESLMAYEYFRKHHPIFHRDAVYAERLEWYEKLPQSHSAHCQERNYSQARQITITGVVEGTREKDRATQEGILKKKSLVLSDPRDQALAAMIHACKHEGEDLFEGSWVRGSVPGFAVSSSSGTTTATVTSMLLRLALPPRN